MGKLIPDDYLGDGVYVSFDGYSIVLDLRGQDNTTQIALEPSVMRGLVRFAGRVKTAVSATVQVTAATKTKGGAV